VGVSHGLVRREIVKARMRTHFVVVAPPRFDDGPSLGARAKLLRHSAQELELLAIRTRSAAPRGSCAANNALDTNSGPYGGLGLVRQTLLAVLGPEVVN